MCIYLFVGIIILLLFVVKDCAYDVLNRLLFVSNEKQHCVHVASLQDPENPVFLKNIYLEGVTSVQGK